MVGPSLPNSSDDDNDDDGDDAADDCEDDNLPSQFHLADDENTI